MNISQLSSFILGKTSDVQNTSECFVHKPPVDNHAALQWDEHIGEMPPFRENVSGLGFLKDEWDQGKGFLKGTALIIWGQSGWQRGWQSPDRYGLLRTVNTGPSLTRRPSALRRPPRLLC